MKLFATLFILSATACATTTQESSAQKSGLVGVYCLEDSQATMQLELKADGTYQAYVDAGLRAIGRASGTWTFENNELLLSQSNETSGWHHYMTPISVQGTGDKISLTGDFYGSLSKRVRGGCEAP